MKETKTSEVRAIFPALDMLEDQELAEKIANVWLELLAKSKWDSIGDAWMDPKIEKKVSLADHVNCIAELVVGANDIISKYHPEAACDRDLLLALVLMHDVSKLTEFEPDGNGGCRFSKQFYGFMHGSEGAYMAKKYDMPEKLVQLIFSHAGQSPVKPQYKEGWLFHYLDFCHFNMSTFGDPGSATYEYVKHTLEE